MVEINFMKVVEGSDVNLYNLGQTSVEFSGKDCSEEAEPVNYGREVSLITAPVSL